MKTLTIPDLEEAVVRKLRSKAMDHGRSVEMEAREILIRSVETVDFLEPKDLSPNEHMKRGIHALTGIWKGRGTTDEMMRELRGDD